LRKLGEHALAWLAGDRGVAIAQHAGDLAAAAGAGFRIANALLSMGRAGQALTLNLSLADRLDGESGTEELRTLYGHVLLQGAMAAAAYGDDARTRDLIGAAREVARFVAPGSNHYRLAFSPVNVALHEVAALVALGENGRAPGAQRLQRPSEPDVLPAPDAIIVAPATVNTINKWAAGIRDTLALGILVEAIGKRLPTVALPFTNRAHAAHPAFTDNISKLRSWGVTVLFGPNVYSLHEPGTGSRYLHLFPWPMAVHAIGHGHLPG
jgi:hypothetical protein